MRLLATVAVLFALVLGGGSALGGCSAAGQDEKLEELSRKVATLEKRLKAVEGGKKGKGKAAKGKSKAGKTKTKAPVPVGPKAKVEVAGDATKVLLTNGKRKFTLPGDVPVGEYTVLASFEESAQPAEAGTATVTEGKVTTLTCTLAEKACTAAEQ